MHRRSIAAALALASLAVLPSVRASAAVVKPLHDAQVSLLKPLATASGTKFVVQLKNGGRTTEAGVAVSVFTDADPVNPVWQGTADLKKGKSKRWTVTLALPANATTLHATCDVAAGVTDENLANNAFDLPIPAAPSGATYSGAISALLAANCTSCHFGAGAPMKIRLDTYSTAKANAARALASIQAGRMPAGSPLRPADVSLFAAWVKAGKPQ